MVLVEAIGLANLRRPHKTSGETITTTMEIRNGIFLPEMNLDLSVMSSVSRRNKALSFVNMWFVWEITQSFN